MAIFDSTISNDTLIALDLERADIKSMNIYNDGEGLTIDVELNSKPHKCPVCSTETSRIKGYQNKIIRHSILNNTPCIIDYRARRYICPLCGKTFFENNPFTNKGSRLSVATVYNVLADLKNPALTFSYVASKYHISQSTVANIFDRGVNIPRRTLPECICFDETYAFKSDRSNYICVLVDYKDKKVIDILPTRRMQDLTDYFYNIPLEERKKVRYVSFDMWQTYRSVAKTMFPNCVTIVDKFHLLQEFTRKATRVRIRIMNKNKKIKDELENEARRLKKEKKKLPPDKQEKLIQAQRNYYILKKFEWMIFSKNKDILNPNLEKKMNHALGQYCNLYDLFNLLENTDEDMTEMINLKDELYDFYEKCTYEESKAKINELIIDFRSSSVPELVSFANTLTQWKPEIINSFIIIPGINKKMNNALIENRNKSIKLLKHSSNGYTNWKRFRNRVLYTINDDEKFKL
ncbi:MAG: ISL3 family transposase [Longibaculum muris]|uniref:Transposase n=2 Tax=Bacillati TaxID=1783272 RepID=A0A4R3YEU5_9FIRM|nr:ISL3 family transposase [Longibaculum muris]KXU43924.1 transposase [Candidatus Stoquefichus sp. KLE1796]MBS5371549.1 ISL3 family transposase [Coprobacillus cateniformis]MCR1889545.1 ISL3 family transposase [Longibaculum muris]MED9812176.1 ISL3 family transposase [Longibaculum muris]TCV89698.1 transposase [Longibaculum muris]